MEPSGAESERPRLNDFLRDARDEILAAWERSLRSAPEAQGMSEPQLRDHIPALLDRVADFVRSVHTDEAVELGDLPDLHALDRLAAGFDIRTAMRELSLLRTTAIDLWRARGGQAGTALDEVRRFDVAIDEVMARSVERYARARERTLASLDRLSAAALGTGDLHAFLPRLLEAALETSENADAVVLFLAEGDVLRVRAAAGLGSEAARELTVRVGEGLAGRVAAERIPALVRSAASDPLVLGLGLRGTPIRALYGVPLQHGGDLVGVACMVSASADDFSQDDQQLFRTMSQRATSIIVQGELVARERTALRERQRALDALEHGDPFLLVDRDWRVVLMNASLERASHEPRSQVLGRVFWEVWPEAKDPSSKYWREYHRCMEDRVPVQFEEYFAPLHVWTEVAAYPAEDGGIAVFVRDVSERKRVEARARGAEEALRRRERELERFFAISPDMLAVVGADGFMKRVNPAVQAALGYSEAELLSRPYLDFTHPDDRAMSRAQLEKVLAGQPAIHFTFRAVRKDGRVRWMTFNASAEKGAQVLAAVGRDVTEERQRTELEQQLIGIVSHDLRNPLSAVLVACGALLRRADQLDERTLESVNRIQAAADRAVALIRDLLDFTTARMPGGIAITPERIDVHVHARAAAEEVRATFPDRELRYEQGGSGEGHWDPARIGQVVANLVSNAFKYGKPGTPVVVRTHGEDGWVRLEVHDEGNPIDPALLPHIFEPLRRGRHTGGVGGVAGVGLGLYIVDHIVRAHGGTIEVLSTAGEGTTFTVRLPREPPKTE